MPQEKTLILFKPDAVQRRLCGRILTRIEERGLKLLGLKMLHVTKELAAQHYAEHVSKPFYPMLEEFITSGPVVALVVEGPEAVAVVRGMMGKTNGRDSAPGTIRGDFGLSRQVNLIHGSDSPEAAAREISIYFKPEEVLEYSTTLADWVCASDEK
ncbi:nucleoside-diphosphate kinase [Planctomicrobium sp. SH661]|uniref:nucleoside-diphosphate kinase n=1 Tax=Planctomicrobium sp. SH661 TaxID=3448124 RepID=UPI003F5B8BAF